MKFSGLWFPIIPERSETVAHRAKLDRMVVFGNNQSYHNHYPGYYRPAPYYRGGYYGPRYYR